MTTIKNVTENIIITNEWAEGNKRLSEYPKGEVRGEPEGEGQLFASEDGDATRVK